MSREVPVRFRESVRVKSPCATRLQVFYSNGDISFVDTKGKDTALSLTKRKMVEDLYPVTIEIVSKV